MSRNLLNEGEIVNVYVNTIDTFEGTLPVVVSQSAPQQPVDIALKGLSAMGGADKIIKVNSGGTALEYADQNWKRIASAYLQPADITDIVSIPPDSYIRFDCEPISALGFELKHDQTGNYFVFREKDGTQIYKYTPTGINPSLFEFGETDDERIILSQNNLRLNNRGNVSFREEATNGTNQINLQAPASLASSATITLPSTTGTLALAGEGGFITSVSSPLAVSSENLTLGTVPISKGGTNLTSYTTGDIIYSSATDTLAKRGIGSTGQVLKVSGGIPVWGTDNAENITVSLPLLRTGDVISLTGLSTIGGAGKIIKVNSGGTALEYADDNNTEYTAQTPLSLVGTEFQLGTVPYNKGGTGLTSYTEGDLLYASADNVLNKLAHGSGGDILRMNGTGTLPEWRTMYGATSPIVLTGGTTFELTTVPVSSGGTGFTGCNSGDMIYSLVANTLTKLNIGSTGQVLKVSGALPVWSDETDTTYTAQTPLSLVGTEFQLGTVPTDKGGTGITAYTAGDILYTPSIGANDLEKLPIGSTGQVLKVSGGVPVWGTDNNTEYTAQTPLSLSGTEFQLGTVPYNKGGTGQSSWTQGDLLYASADNVLAKLAHGTAGQVLKIDSAGEVPEWGTLTGATPFTTSGNLLYPTDTTLRLLVGSTANPNDYKLRVNGDAYINGPTYIEQSTDFGIRLIRSGFNGIAWYASEADAQGNTNRKAYIQADTGANGKMYFDCLSQQFIFGDGGSTTGRVGINRNTPQFPLDVDSQLNDTSASVNYRYITTLSAGGPVQVYNTTAKFDGRIWITDVIYNSSDRRIKENINQLNSSQSLEIIDKLKVCEYTMKDIKRNGSAKHLGYIAQEVEAVYPLAVNDSNEYIPDIYKNVDCVYTKVGEEYKVKISELGEVAGVEYRFYVWVGEEDKNEISLELVGNEDNTFTFEKEYENVFCYGKKVSDFKTLEKETLYDLNVSATQELHNEIKSLKTEVSGLKEIINQLINSKSFADFKKTIA
jgi:hypothetical protein